MAEGLQYKIGADVAGFQAGITKATQGLSKLDQASAKTFKNIQSSANQGAFALNSIGQVARDLPFGFIAIQNNLPIVIDQFGALVKTSGGVGGALKSLGAALAGPAGITFAIGAVIAGTTALIQKYGSLGEALKALSATDREAFESQKRLADIRKEAAEDAGQEIAKLVTLTDLAANVAASTETRRRAIVELRKEYGGYLKNVTDEALLNNQAADAINRAKDAILNKALALAAEKKIAEIGAQILENEIAKIDAATKYGRALDINRKANEQALREGVKGAAAINNAAVTAQTELAGTRQELERLGAEGVKLQQTFDQLRRLQQGFALKAGENILPEPKGPKNSTQRVSQAIAIPVRLDLATITVSEIQKADAEIKRLFRQENGVGVPLVISPEVPPAAIASFQKFTDGIKDNLAQVKQFSEALAAQLSESFSNVFASLGEGIGNVLSGVSNGFSAAQLVLSGLADILINVGKLAISTGVAILGIKKALQSLNPYVAIGAGVALVALGTAVKGKLSSSVPKFAEGGIVTRPTAGIFGEAGPEAVMPLDKLNALINNTGGSGGTFEFAPLRIRGNDLYASIERTRQQQGRAF